MMRKHTIGTLLGLAMLVGCTTPPQKAAITGQVALQLQIAKVNLEDVRSLLTRKAQPLDATDIMELVRAGKGSILYAPVVETLQGQEAVLKATREEIFPAKDMNETNTPTPTATNPFASQEPEFQTREVGVIFQVVPEIRPDGWIGVTMSPNAIFDPAWRRYLIKAPDGHILCDTNQPIFGTQYISTSVRFREGETIMIGGGTLLPEGDSLAYMLLSARIRWQR